MTDHAITCPKCSRQVEAGFKFCDYCGAKLQAPAAAPTTSAGTPATKDEPQAEEAPETTPIKPPPIPIEVPERKKPLLERMRERRAERAAAEVKAAAEAKEAKAKAAEPKTEDKAEDKTEEPKPPEVKEPEKKEAPVVPPVPSVGTPRPPEAGRPTTPTPPPTPTPPTTPPPRITSKPMRAEELREHQGVAIAGRLRWREGEAPPGPEDTVVREGPVPAPPPATTWRPAERPEPAKRSSVGKIAVFLLHVVAAFVAGAVLVAIAAVVASLASNGRVALLEIRGLPILIAGATAIVVFSLLRTGPKASGDRRSVALGVLTGFVILVAAVTLTYRPSLMETGQRELDRTLGIFGPEVSESVDRFHDDVDSWNQEVGNYRTDLLAVTNVQKREPDAEKRDAAAREFSVAASGVEAALEGVQKRMVSHADAIEQAPLHDAMKDLAAIYSEELGGIRLLTRGFVTNDQVMIKSGDTRFKDATARAVEFFDERVRPILERADIDPEPLADSIGALTR